MLINMSAGMSKIYKTFPNSRNSIKIQLHVFFIERNGKGYGNIKKRKFKRMWDGL